MQLCAAGGEDLIAVEDPSGLLEAYSPDDCTPCYYFDVDNGRLQAELKFRYGEQEVPYGLPASRDLTVKRNVRQEQAAQDPLRRYFQEDSNGVFVMEKEEAMYDFLTDVLDTFHSYGEVYVSQRLGDKQIRPSSPTVGISVSDGLLSLDLDTGEFPPEELEGLYRSLLRKQKYHRLKDGRFLKLDGSPYETLAEMAHMTLLPAKDLVQGHVTVPAYRGLYLDALLGKNEGLQVNRDRQFRSMVRNFKSVAESDYQVPAPIWSQCSAPTKRWAFNGSRPWRAATLAAFWQTKWDSERRCRSLPICLRCPFGKRVCPAWWYAPPH